MAEKRKHLGKWGEEIALGFLKKKKFKILARNYRCTFGEIDIIAQDRNNVISFIEVKTRTSHVYGSPQEAVNPRKQSQICKVAMDFVQRHNLENRQARFDVLAVQLLPSGYTMDFVENAFELTLFD